MALMALMIKWKKIAKLDIRKQCQLSRVSQSLLPILSDRDIIMGIDKELIKIPETTKPIEELISSHKFITNQTTNNIQNQSIQGARPKEHQHLQLLINEVLNQLLPIPRIKTAQYVTSLWKSIQN